MFGIFPGSATPSVFPAGEPFWIGYGFVPEPTDAGEMEVDILERRFELEVDGHPVELATEVTSDRDGRRVSKHDLVSFARASRAFSGP